MKCCPIALTLSLVLAAGSLFAVVAGAGPKSNPEAVPSSQPTTKPIFNKNCPITKEPIDPKGKTFVYKDKTIGFCCDSCVADFKKDPEKYMKDLK